MSFVNAVKSHNYNISARTANGMQAHNTTKSATVDLFGLIGAARGNNITREFSASLAENQDLTLRMLLWARDIRGGAGERQTFRSLLAYLEASNPELAGRLMSKIPELGRWDDLFTYVEPKNRRAAFELIRAALLNGDSLCAKWMPRKGTIAVELTRFLGISPKQYRKLVVGATKVVEQAMCAKRWYSINFSHVPSVASARYQKAFGRNAAETYSAYIRELQKPVEQRDSKVKINAGAVYPYDVLKSVMRGSIAVANEQWKALPNYIGNARILPMVDVSGSMGSIYYGDKSELQPIDVAISLGLYISEKNSSEFKDMFMTFSAHPKLELLRGDFSQRVAQLSRANWDMNTNLHAAFDEMLTIALRGSVAPEDMPEILLILSDMQFDACARYDNTAMQMITRKYQAAGYAVPKIVFWNLSMAGKQNGNSPVRFDERNTAHISGFSPAIMKAVLANDLEDYTPYNVMVKTLNNERYDY